MWICAQNTQKQDTVWISHVMPCFAWILEQLSCWLKVCFLLYTQETFWFFVKCFSFVATLHTQRFSPFQDFYFLRKHFLLFFIFLLYWRHVLLLVYTSFSRLNFNWRCTMFPLSASVHVEVFAPVCKCKRVSGTSPWGSVCFHLLRLPCSEYVCFLDNLVPDAAITMGMVLLNEAATSKGDVGKRRSKSAKLFRFPFFVILCYCRLLGISSSCRPTRFEHLYEALWISRQWWC